MKIVIASLVLATLTGCSSIPFMNSNSGGSSNSTNSIQSQTLVSNFARRGVKVEFECKWYSIGCDSLVPTSIEVTAYATSNGNSESNRETAFHVAEMNAKAKMRRFIKEDISTSSVTNTISRNIEKANDQIKKQTAVNGGTVNMTEEEAAKDSNLSVRVNTNDITRTVTETVRVNASGILRGVRVIDEEVVDRQTVKVTIRWDSKSEAASQFFNKRFAK